MIIANLKTAAETVGINAFITNSNEKIETQLNRLTREEDLPIMLVSWDIQGSVSFDAITGFINNPAMNITCLLVTKPEDGAKEEAEKESENMAKLFLSFLQVLADIQKPLLRTGEFPISNATFTMVPVHGSGKHSGAMGKFTVLGQLDVPCQR